MAKVSIIIPTLNEGDNLRKTVTSLLSTTTGNFEIIVVDNGSLDGCSAFLERDGRDSRIRLFKTERLGVANARNFGAKHASGDVLFFVDAHVLFPKGWSAPMLQILDKKEVAIVAPAVSDWRKPDSKGYGFKWRNSRLDILWLKREKAWPYPIPMAAGMFQGFRTNVFNEMGCYDSGMINFGSEDAEICLRAWLLGYQVYLLPQVEISHLFRSRHPYKVCWQDIVYNMLRMVRTHFNEQRIQRCIKVFKSFPSFDSASRLLGWSDIGHRAQIFAEKRVHNDDWFFKYFSMDL